MINERDQPTRRVGDAGAGESSIRTVYVGLGSNLGDREANLREAVERIKALGLNVTRTSSVYETEPVGYKGQPWFLNQVIEAKYLTFDAGRSNFMLEAEELLRALLGIELEMGRERTIPDGPRVIDIDLLIYSRMDGFIARTMSDPANPNLASADAPRGMIVPHPRMHLRRFVLQPLCEIAPDLMHPIYKKTCREILAALDDPAIVRVYDAQK